MSVSFTIGSITFAPKEPAEEGSFIPVNFESVCKLLAEIRQLKQREQKLVEALKKIAAYEHVQTCRLSEVITVYECVCNESPEPREVAKNILKELGVEE